MEMLKRFTFFFHFYATRVGVLVRLFRSSSSSSSTCIRTYLWRCLFIYLEGFGGTHAVMPQLDLILLLRPWDPHCPVVLGLPVNLIFQGKRFVTVGKNVVLMAVNCFLWQPNTWVGDFCFSCSWGRSAFDYCKFTKICINIKF